MATPAQILHVINWDKFTSPFIEFVEAELPDSVTHVFLVLGHDNNYEIRRRENILFAHELSKLALLVRIIKLMNLASKIVFHGLFDGTILRLLTVQPWLLRKSYWAIWGGDLYGTGAQRSFGDESFRRFVFRRIGHLLTYVDGDVELARSRYGARGKYIRCFLYPSNLYQQYPALPAPHRAGECINILVGNSADPTNEHIEVLDVLAERADACVKIFVPLSYGDATYATHVIEYGKRLFGDRFVPITEFLPFDRYMEFLATVDIAIFNHRRQQAMGTTIALLGLGKKVVLRSDVAQARALRELGLQFGSLDEFSRELLTDEQALKNESIVREYFSKQQLIQQYKEVFN